MGSALQGIAWAVPYAVGKTVQNYQVLDCGYNLGQAVCIQKTSTDIAFFSRISKVADRFFLIDSISLITTGIDLFIKTRNKYEIIDEIFRWIFSFRNPHAGFTSLGMAIAVPLGTLGAISFGATSLLNRCFHIHFGKTITGAQWIKPKTEQLKQMLFVARIVVNIALICFSPLSPLLAISISAELYSLVKIAQRKWLRFTIERDYELRGQGGPIGPGPFAFPAIPGFSRKIADKLRFDYTFLLQGGSSRHQQTTGSEDTCGICLEDKPDTHFCNFHVFHPLCIQEMLKNSTESFATNPHLVTTKRTVHETQHKTNGVYTHSTYHASYLLKANQSDLPSCPSCRTRPDHSEISIALRDVDYGWSQGRIQWKTAN